MLGSNKQQAAVTTTVYSYDNPILHSSSGVHRARSTDKEVFPIPFAEEGVVDLGISITHTYKAASVDVDLKCTIQPLTDFNLASQGGKLGQALWNDFLPSGGNFIFVSERGNTKSDPGRAVIAVPELRQPIPEIWIYLVAESIPDEGELYIHITRRY